MHVGQGFGPVSMALRATDRNKSANFPLILFSKTCAAPSTVPPRFRSARTFTLRR
jgi:hypothetical protein